MILKKIIFANNPLHNCFGIFLIYSWAEDLWNILPLFWNINAAEGDDTATYLSWARLTNSTGKASRKKIREEAFEIAILK